MKTISIHNEELDFNGQYFDIVLSDVIKYDNELTTLKNIPKEIYGDLYLQNNLISSLEYFPTKITGDIFLYCNKIESLEYMSDCTFNGLVHLSYNNITSLKGLPRKCKDLIIHNNELKNFKYCPEVIDGRFKFSKNPINDYSYFPDFIAYEDEIIDELYEDKIINHHFEIFRKKKGVDYWKDLLQYFIDNHLDLNLIEWKEGIVNDDIIKSNEGLSKFDL